MKKHLILAAMALTALFSACNNDDSTPLNEETVPVSFTIGGIDSRTTTDNNFATTFDKDGNEKVGIFSSTNVNAVMSNSEFTVNTNGKLESTTSYTYGDGTAYFNAYYPYQEVDGESTTIPFTINSDQRSNFGTNDFIIAKGAGTNEEPEVNLEFTHTLAFVQIEIEANNATIASATMNSVKSGITFTPDITGTTAGTVETNNNSSIVVISMYKVSENKYWAIIPAQTCTNSKALFSLITTDGDLYTFTPSEDITFQANRIHKYKLSVTAATPVSAVFSTSAVTVANWTTIDTDPTTSTETTITNLTTINPTINENFVTAMQSKSWDALIGENPIWAYNSVTSTYDMTTESVKLAPSSVGWYRGLIYYSGTNNLLIPGKKYKLTLKVKATNNNNNQGLWITVRNKTHFYDVNNGSPSRYIGTTNYTMDFSDEQITYITASNCYNSNSGTPVVSSTETASPFYIIISPRTANEEYYIKDIILVEVTE